MSTHNKEAAALRKYGRHLGDCLGGLSSSKRACTCGFDAALTASEAAATEQAPPLPEPYVRASGILPALFSANQAQQYAEQYAAWKIAALRSEQAPTLIGFDLASGPDQTAYYAPDAFAQSVGNSDELATVKQSLMVEQAPGGAQNLQNKPEARANAGCRVVPEQAPAGEDVIELLRSMRLRYGTEGDPVTGSAAWRRRIDDAIAAISTPPAVPPKGWREFIEECATFAGKMVNGNRLSMQAKSLISAAPAAPQGEQSK